MIDNEKRKWMKSVGIIEFPYPVSFMYQFKGDDTVWLWSEKDVAEKSLEELRATYEKDKEKVRNGRKMRNVIYSISVPAKFCKENNVFETLDVIADVDAGIVNLVSEDKKSVIRLDLIGTANLGDTLQKITGSNNFQSALSEKIVEYTSRNNAMNGTVL